MGKPKINKGIRGSHIHWL